MIKKIFSIGVTVSGILVVLYTLIISMLTNFNAGNIMVLLTGLCFIAFGTIWTRLPKNRIVKLFKILVYTGFAFLFCMMAFIYIASETNECDFNEDAVIVLGNALHGEEPSPTLKRRLNRCIEYNKENPNAIIIVSGGQGPQEDTTEANAMKKYLVENGVPENIIIKEDKATSTNENFKYSKEILDSVFDKDYKVVYITNDFHSYRSSKLAEINGIKATSFTTKTDNQSILPAYMREVLAVIQLWVFKQ